jgi:hypothetical protein
MSNEKNVIVQSIGNQNMDGKISMNMNTQSEMVVEPVMEGKIMQEEKSNVVMLVGNTNKDEKVVMNTQPVVVEDSLATFISKYYADASKGPSVVNYIDNKFGGDLDEAIATLVGQESTKPLAMALIEYEVYLEDLSRMKREALEANRPQKTRKDPVIRHDKKQCEICGGFDAECKPAVIGSATVLVCPGCIRFEDSQRSLTGIDRFNYLKDLAGLDVPVTNEGNYPVVSVPVIRGLPEHPTKPGFRLVVPNITDEEKKELKTACGAEVKVIGMKNENTVRIQLVKVYQPKAPEKRTFFAQLFYKNGSLHVEAAEATGITKRISIPRNRMDEIIVDRKFWGMWQLEVIKEENDFIFANPVKKVEDDVVPDQQHPKVFYATVKIFDGELKITSDKMKRITVPRESRERLRYGLGVWKVRVLEEGDDYIFVKPVEHIQSKGINKNEYVARLNELQTKGRLEL